MVIVTVDFVPPPSSTTIASFVGAAMLAPLRRDHFLAAPKFRAILSVDHQLRAIGKRHNLLCPAVGRDRCNGLSGNLFPHCIGKHFTLRIFFSPSASASVEVAASKR